MRSIKPKGLLKILGMGGLIVLTIVTLKYGLRNLKPVDIIDVDSIGFVKRERPSLNLNELKERHGELPVSFEAYFAGHPDAKGLRADLAEMYGRNPEKYLEEVTELKKAYEKEFKKYDLNGDGQLGYDDDTNGDGSLSSADRL